MESINPVIRDYRMGIFLKTTWRIEGNMRPRRTSSLVAIIIVLVTVSDTGGLHAESVLGRCTSVGGYFQNWINAREQVENGIVQAGSGDKGDEIASGFSIRRARLQLDFTDEQRHIHACFSVKFEKRTELLDCYGAISFAEWIELHVGQMKTPTDYENLASPADLDFITKSTLSQYLTDWSLSRTPYISPLMGNRSYQRDLGLALRGTLYRRMIHYFAMVGNGLGANLFIGGRENKGFIFTNDPGEYFYSLRCDITPVKRLSIGGHICFNDHDNTILNDEKTVLDLHRMSYSCNAVAFLPGNISMTGMIGGGSVDDDYYRTGKENYEYFGWEGKVLWRIAGERLSAGVRYDVYDCEFNESGNVTSQMNWTLGVNSVLNEMCKVQVNYIHKRTDDPVEPDLGDDLFVVNLQLRLTGI
jgi:hypothetical protein